MPTVGRKGEGTHVQSVIFPADKWTEAEARAWLKEHDMYTDGLERTENTLRFRQVDPDDGKFRYRTKQQVSNGKPFTLVIGFEKSYLLSLTSNSITVKEVDKASPEYLEALAEKLREQLDPETYKALHSLALPIAGGRASWRGVPDSPIDRAALLGISPELLKALDDEELVELWETLSDWAARAQRTKADTERFIKPGLLVQEEMLRRNLDLGDSSLVDLLTKAKWTTAQINDLPDSAFLYIEPGGRKDETGRTVPRSLRHFPVRGPDGKLDAAHLRNAIARIPQSNAAGLTPEKKKELQDKARKLLEQLREKAWKAKARVAKISEQQIIYCIAIDADAEDTEGEYIAKEDIPRIAHGYMMKTGGRSVTINHEEKVACYIVESWIAKEKGKLGKEGYKEGDWLVGIYVPDPVLWEQVKKLGTGVSIGGYCLPEE